MDHPEAQVGREPAGAAEVGTVAGRGVPGQVPRRRTAPSSGARLPRRRVAARRWSPARAARVRLHGRTAVPLDWWLREWRRPAVARHAFANGVNTAYGEPSSFVTEPGRPRTANRSGPATVRRCEGAAATARSAATSIRAEVGRGVDGLGADLRGQRRHHGSGIARPDDQRATHGLVQCRQAGQQERQPGRAGTGKEQRIEHEERRDGPSASAAHSAGWSANRRSRRNHSTTGLATQGALPSGDGLRRDDRRCGDRPASHPDGERDGTDAPRAISPRTRSTSRHRRGRRSTR